MTTTRPVVIGGPHKVWFLVSFILGAAAVYIYDHYLDKPAAPAQAESTLEVQRVAPAGTSNQ